MQRALIPAVALLITAAAWASQRDDAFLASRDHPAIAYSTAPTRDAVALLNQRLDQGQATLTYEPGSGYLRSVLSALAIPVESQVVIFSQTSFQARKISMKNPRAVLFNDTAAVGFVRGGDILEVAAQDPAQGTILYTLPQTPQAAPRFTRDDKCLACHLSWDTRAVPGQVLLTTFPRPGEDAYANGYFVDHRAPIRERWGGWFVTGARVPERHMGNLPMVMAKPPEPGAAAPPVRRNLEGQFDLAGYPSVHSDVVALMVLDHQAHAQNLMTRAGWEYRAARHETAAATSARVHQAVLELADYLLFVDEAPLPAPVRGASGFAELFAAMGPRDRKGRSLRELDLTTRLLRYPCSYMIYAPSFDGLPEEVRAAVFRRIATILDGRDTAARYRHLTASVRTAIREILLDTRPGFAAAVASSAAGR